MTDPNAHLAIEPLEGDVDFECTAAIERDPPRLVVRGTLRNHLGDELWVFREPQPFVRVLPNEIALYSLMPILVPWTKVLMPHVPAVVRVAREGAFELQGSYEIPLRETHPYPAAPVRSVPMPARDEEARLVSLRLGYFPASDDNALVTRADRSLAPEYYGLRRQFVVCARVEIPPIPVRRILWTDEGGPQSHRST
jgi:hypothetical protein